MVSETVSDQLSNRTAHGHGKGPAGGAKDGLRGAEASWGELPFEYWLRKEKGNEKGRRWELAARTASSAALSLSTAGASLKTEGAR